MKSKGLEKEEDYPTSGVSSTDCNYDQSKASVQLTSVVYPIVNNPQKLKEAIVENPVIAVIQADVEFLFYQSGILDSDSCSSSTLHPVLIVGYG